jgi:trimeric autotransporter adhesin
MKKTKKALASLAIAGMVLSMAPMSVFGATDSNRISGAGRVETAIAIAAEGWTAADSVIVVPADDANMVDALAAAPLAGQLNAPILVTYKGALDAQVQQKIVDLKAKNVYAIGALSADVVNSLKAIAGVTVEQIQGMDRSETAAKVAAKLTKVNGTFVVAYDGKADALSAASFAAANSYKIVIANPDGTVAAGATVAPTYTVGGQVTVAGATALKGADRYATNDAVLDGLTYSYDKVYVANGQSLVDALAGAPLAAKTKSPIVLADDMGAGTAANDNLTASSKVMALGGVGAVSDAVLGKVAYVAPATLAVQSVTAINAKQVEVKFNRAVDETSAETIGNYYIKLSGASTYTALTNQATAELQDDGVTVILTTTSGVANSFGVASNNPYKFQVKDVRVDGGEETAAKYEVVLYNTDKVAPTYTSATAKAKTTTTSITLKFSEPVDYAAATVTVKGAFASLAAGSKANEITVTTGDNLTAGTAYDMVLAGFKDFAGNVLEPNPVTTTVTVTSDVSAPSVTDVKVVRDSLIEVTFDKGIDAATLTGNLKVLDGNLNATGITHTVAIKADTDKKVATIALTALPFNSDNVFNGFVTYSDSIKDESGNKLAAGTKSVSITKDKTAPAVVSSSYKNVTSYHGIATANGAVVVKFNEKLNVVAGATYILMDQDGNTLANTIGTPAINADDMTELVLPLGSAIATNSKTYMIVVPKNAVTDKAISANQNSAANITVDVAVGGPTASDSTKPAIAVGTTTAATSATSGTTITLGITDAGGSNLDLTTVANVGNYRLNGAPLPDGSYVTYALGVATMNIPAGSIKLDGSYSLSVTGIKDKAGNLADTYLGSVALKDDVKPELKTATLNTNGSITLEFTEDVISAPVGATADFVVKLDGAVLAAGAYTIVDGTGADSGKYVLTVTGVDVNTVSSFSVGTVTTPTSVKDASIIGIPVKGGKTITVK